VYLIKALTVVILVGIATAKNRPACTVSDWVVIPSTVEMYIDLVNGKEVQKARALAITPTNCDPDTTATADTLKAK